MTTRDFQLKIKSLDDSGTFRGYAAVYSNVDFGGDQILPGAFAKTISQQGDGLPLLWSHEQQTPIGTCKLSDGAQGLICDGKLILSDASGARVFNLLQQKIVRGLSVGYTLPKDPTKVAYSPDGSTRILKELHVHEVSCCTIPMNAEALITSVKSLSEVESLLRSYKRDPLKSDDRAVLRNIFAELNRLMGKSSACECECGDCPDNCDACSDGCDLCDGDVCSGCVARAEGIETASAIKAFALSLKGMLLQ